MQNRKWILGMVTVAGVCLMAASLWPVETGAAGEKTYTYELSETEKQRESHNNADEKAGQPVDSVFVQVEQYREASENAYTSAESENSAEEFSVYYAKTAVRLRKEPDTDSDILTVIDRGEQVEFSGEMEENDWCLVRYNNLEGYLKFYHLKEDCGESAATDSETTDKNKWEYLGNYYITGYRMFSASENGGRSDGVTASGVVGTPGYTAAMKDIPFGTTIYVDGLGYYVVEDRGVGEECVDIACNTTSETYELTGHRDVYIVR